VRCKFFHDAARQKLLKSASDSRSYSKNKSGLFFETRCAQLLQCNHGTPTLVGVHLIKGLFGFVDILCSEDKLVSASVYEKAECDVDVSCCSTSRTLEVCSVSGSASPS